MNVRVLLPRKGFVFSAVGCSVLCVSLRLYLLIIFQSSLVLPFYFGMLFLSVAEIGILISPAILGIYPFFPFNSVNFSYLFEAHVVP